MKKLIALALACLLSTNALAVSYEQSFRGIPPEAYTDFASFPILATDGAMAVDKSTDTIYVYDLGTTSWVAAGGGGGGSGTVTSVSVVAANGFSGSVANSTTTPAITVATSISGLLKGNGTALLAAVAGTDYLAPFAGTTLQYVRGDGSLATLNSAIVPELTNLYFTDARAIAAPLTGYTSGAGTVAATDSILQAIQKLNGNSVDGLATKWSLAGNTGTGGTAKLGTTDAQNFDIIAGNSTIVSVVESYKGLSAAPTVVPADATAINQFDWRTFVDPSASTTGANHSNIFSQLVWDNADDGFDNSSGSLIASNNSFTNNGSGTINYASTNTNAATFNNAGTTTQFKGVTSENQIATGTTVSDYSGLVSGLNTTGGVVPASNSLSLYGNFTDATIGNATNISGNLSFSGTTANSQGVNGVNSFLQFNDSTTTTNGVNGLSSGIDVNNTAALNGINGSNVYINMRDTATHGGINLNSVGLNQEDSAVNTGGVNGFNANLQFSGTSDTAGVNIFNGYVNTVDTAHLDSLTGINLNPEIQGTSDVDNITMGSFSGQIRGSSTVDNLTGVTVNPQMSGSAAVTNFTGLNVSPQVNGTSTLASSLTGIQLSPSSAADLPGVKGIDINMSGATLSAAAIAAGEHKTAISTDGAISAGYSYTVPAAATFFQQHYLGGTANVANGAPTSAFGFGTNLAQTVTLHDDWSIDASGLGYVDVGFVGALNFDTGTTMAKWTGALGGAGNPGGAGTLTDAIMFRAAGILPQGGTLTVTNAYGFQVDPVLACLTGTNCWGFFEDTAAAENHLSKLAIGTSTKKVANSDTALEIGNSKSFLNGRGTTATKNALTALAGMQFYDTTLSQLQWYNGASWVNAGSTSSGDVVGPGSATDDALARYDGITGKIIQNSNATLTDAGTLTAPAFSGPLTGNVTGNADTATALAANPSDCGAGTKATAIAANGDLTCSAVALAADVSGTLPVANGGFGTEAQEAPTGTINNSNDTFVLANTPTSNASVKLYQSGLILVQGTDYTLAGDTITMVIPPNFWHTLYANYRY